MFSLILQPNRYLERLSLVVSVFGSANVKNTKLLQKTNHNQNYTNSYPGIIRWANLNYFFSLFFNRLINSESTFGIDFLLVPQNERRLVFQLGVSIIINQQPFSFIEKYEKVETERKVVLIQESRSRWILFFISIKMENPSILY